MGFDGAADPLRQLPQVTDLLGRQLREALDHPPRADENVACTEWGMESTHGLKSAKPA